MLGTLGRFAAISALVSVSLLTGCSAKKPTALTLALSTEGRVPAEVDHLDVDVVRDGATGFEEHYELNAGDPLPGTLTIQNQKDEDPTHPVIITVTAKKSDSSTLQIVRSARLGFVDEHTKLLRMPLRYSCLDSSCPGAQTCVAGSCVSYDIDVATLPDFDGSALFIAKGSGACFDDTTCLADPQPVTVDGSTSLCGFAAPAAAGKFNVGMIWSATNVVAHTVAVDPDQEEGFVVSGNRVTLAPGLCNAILGTPAAGHPTVLEVVTSTACNTKSTSEPICIDTTGGGGGMDVGLSGPQGSSAKIPAGSYSGSPQFAIMMATMGTYPAIPSGLAQKGSVFAYTPHGTKFTMPAHIAVPYTASATPTADLQLITSEPGDSTWTQVSGATPLTDTTHTFLQADVKSFSFFVVVGPSTDTGMGGAGGSGGMGQGGNSGKGGAAGMGGKANGGAAGASGQGGSGQGGIAGQGGGPGIGGAGGSGGCCVVDTDCGPKGQFECVTGTCEITPQSGLCWRDSDCQSGSVCVGQSVCQCGGACAPNDVLGSCMPGGGGFAGSGGSGGGGPTGPCAQSSCELGPAYGLTCDCTDPFNMAVCGCSKSLICASIDSYCCDVAWDATCVAEAFENCPAVCPGGTTTGPIKSAADLPMSIIGSGKWGSCAVTQADGSLWCWGNASNFAVPDSSTPMSGVRRYPRHIPGVTGVTAIAMGSQHACVVEGSQTVMCWGSNSNGQLGTSSIGTSTDTMVAVENLPAVDIVSISVGGSTSCVVLADTSLYCWGNSLTAVGGPNAMPTTKMLDGPVLQVSVGESQACAILMGGEVECWGDDNAGQLGNGLESMVIDPPQSWMSAMGTGPETNVTQVAVGLFVGCVLRGDNTVACAGTNGDGAIAISPAGGLIDLPHNIANLTGVTSLVVADERVCAVQTNGGVVCWGDNNASACGLPKTSTGTPPGTCSPEAGTISYCMAPQTLLDATGMPFLGVKMLAAAAEHSCAVRNDGTVWCWGENGNGQLGLGYSGADAISPVQLLFPQEGP